MLRKKFFISDRLIYSKSSNADGKAMKDIYLLLKKNEYKNLRIGNNNETLMYKIINELYLYCYILSLKKQDIVFYAIPNNFTRIKIISLIKRVKRFSTICFINDLNSIRYEPINKKLLRKELNILQNSDCILAPNCNSCEILQNKYQIKKNILPVTVWDYLTTFSPIKLEVNKNFRDIVFAGNLNKSPFIYELKNVPLKFYLWGKGYNESQISNIEYCGISTPDKIIPLISQYSWGLVWDGPSVNSCTGGLGKYLEFNNSHKCGLYLASRIPIIVWEKSGMASFVIQHKVGICVKSLYEAANIINSLSMYQYLEYKKNAFNIGINISKGMYFTQALHWAEDSLK